MTNPVEPPVAPPAVLSGRLQQVSARNEQLPHDLTINGIPFLLAPAGDDPYVRDWQDGQKQQFDTSQEAGENSFGTWWLRSQMTFHGGQGQLYLDSTDTRVSRARYWTSRYAYPHTAGELTIAGTPQAQTVDLSGVEQVTWSAVQKAAFASTIANEIRVYDLPNLDNEQIITVGAAGVTAAFTSDGARLFVAIGDAIHRIDPGGTVTQTHTMSFVGPVALGYAKHRLIVCNGPQVHELDPDPDTPPVAVGEADAHYVNPAPDYAYTAVADGPEGIYLAGHAGPRADVSRMQVSESSGTLTLGAPVVQLSMPPGEVVRDVFFYVSSFFVLATSSGARVGSFTAYGQPQMGPFTVEGTSCHAVTGSRSLIWVGAENGGIWWVDLSTPIDDAGRYAHALFADGLGDTTSDHINGLTVFPSDPDLVFATTADSGLVYQTSYQADTPAEVVTSWARFGTVEPKQLHYIRVTGNFPRVEGVQRVATVRVESDEGGAAEFHIEGGRSTYEFATASLAPAHAFRLTVTLRDAGSGNGVALHSYQLKALPTAKRFAQYIVPVHCFDLEQAVDGREFGYRGFAADRLQALESYANTAATVTVDDKLVGDRYRAVIQRLQFRQASPPSRDNGLGGVVSLALRRV